MKKLTKILLVALMAIPFLQSCNAEVEMADKAALVTVQKSLDPAGFYGILDNGERLYPGVMRTTYTPSKELQRAIVYFSDLEEPKPGYEYNADVFNVAEVTTQHVTEVNTPAADTLTNGIQITNAWIGGGFLNVEFQINVEMYYTKNLTLALQDMRVDRDGEDYTGDYYPFELGFKAFPAIENGVGTTVSSMACFYLGEMYSLETLGCKGYEIKYRSLNSYVNEPDQFLIVTPEKTGSISF